MKVRSDEGMKEGGDLQAVHRSELLSHILRNENQEESDE